MKDSTGPTTSKKISLLVVDPGEPEADLHLALANAKTNFNRIETQVSAAIQEQEATLLARIKALPGNPIRKLRWLYREAEQIMGAMAPFVACQSGCSGCCHYPVGVMPIEVDLIENCSGKKRLNIAPPQAADGTPCPFLVANRCSIYNHRPMVCRKHVALTTSAYWCQPERANEHEFPMMGLSGLQEAFEHVLGADGRWQPLDIREAFGNG